MYKNEPNCFVNINLSPVDILAQNPLSDPDPRCLKDKRPNGNYKNEATPPSGSEIEGNIVVNDVPEPGEESGARRIRFFIF